MAKLVEAPSSSTRNFPGPGPAPTIMKQPSFGSSRTISRRTMGRVSTLVIAILVLIKRSQVSLISFRKLDSFAEALDFDAPINIQFTSGTTGSPKAATLTHHNIVNNATLSSRIMRFTEKDRLCMPVPMYHCFGMVLGTLLCTTTGAAIVLPSAGFEASACLEAISDERCTAAHGVPTMFIAMLDDPDFDNYDLSSLRTGIMAGAPCPIELMHRVIDDMNMHEITIGYGMTETGPLATQTLPDDPIELRVGTVGQHRETAEAGHSQAGILQLRGFGQ